MPLGYILDRFPVLSETFIVRELEGLERLGVTPALWTLRPAEGAAPSEAAARLAKRVRVLPGPLSAAAARARFAALFRAPGRFLAAGFALARGCSRSARTFVSELVRANAAFTLAREAEREGVTHIHAHFGFVPSTVAWLAWRTAGVPYSVSVHAWDIFVNRSMMPEKLLAARRVVTCSVYARRFLLKRYPALRPERVVAVHHGLDTGLYSARPLPGGDTLRVLAVGRLTEKKGFPVLLRAFARARDEIARDPPRGNDRPSGRRGAELTIVGDGPERRRLEDTASSLRLGASFRMTGAIGPAAVRAEMERAHVLAAPSVRGARGDMDGLPNVVLEAMALARPVVGSNLSGIPEAVHDGRTGLLTPPGDEEALARAMVRLARDRGLAGRLGAAARKLVERDFSLEISSRRLATVFREMGAIP